MTYLIDELDEKTHWPAWWIHREFVTHAVIDTSMINARPSSTYGWFSGYSNLTVIDGLNFLNTSEVTDMNAMFADCRKLKDINLSNFDTHNVTEIAGMFLNCSSANELDVSGFDFSNVKESSYMFMACTALTSLDFSNFDAINVTDTRSMFEGCFSLKTIYFSDACKMSKVENSMNMFKDCSRLVGGQGTVYDENHVDGEYARIDGGPESPGYFTAK